MSSREDGVEAVGGLVEQHQPRVVHQRLGELDALLHAGGVAADRPVALLVQPDVAQHVGGALARRGVRQPRHLGHVHDEVAGGDVGRQAVVLGHVADQRADRARRRSRRRGRARVRGAARSAGTSPSRILISVDLPAPLAPTSPVTPWPDGDVERVERGDARVALRQTRRRDHRPAGRRAPVTLHGATLAANSADPPSTDGGSGSFQGCGDDLAGLVLHPGEVLGAAEGLGVDLVDVLGARRAGGEPRRLGGDLEPADRRAVAGRLGELRR